MKKILVTGGCGFIGANLCRKLVTESNNYVICLDNLYCSSFRNVETLTKLNNFKFVNHNVIEPYDYEVDEIYNAACPASPLKYQQDSIFTIKTSVLGAINCLDLANKYDAKVMQFSTSEIYGEPEVHPQVETYNGNVNITGLRSCYDEGKRISETLFFDYWRKYHTKIKVIRIFNTYGPFMQQNDGRVISNFIIKAINNENIQVYGDGKQTRSFQYIDDLIAAIITYMNMDGEFPGPINIGNPHEITINELAEIILNKIYSKTKIIYNNLPSDDPTRRQPNIDLAKKVLNNWEPKIDISEGLDKTIEYFKQSYNS